MNRFIPSLILACTFGSLLFSQDPVGPPPAGQPQKQPVPDLLIPLSTKSISLVFRVNSRDGRLYQAYFGTKLEDTDYLKQMRDAGHPAYATFGTDNLFEPAVRATHNDGNPSLELKYVSHDISKPIGMEISTGLFPRMRKTEQF